MATWLDNYKKGDRVDVFVFKKWMPGCVVRRMKKSISVVVYEQPKLGELWIEVVRKTDIRLTQSNTKSIKDLNKDIETLVKVLFGNDSHIVQRHPNTMEIYQDQQGGKYEDLMLGFELSNNYSELEFLEVVKLSLEKLAEKDDPNVQQRKRITNH